MKPTKPTKPVTAPGRGGAKVAAAAQIPGALNPQQLRQMQLMVKQAMGLLLADDSADMIVNKAKQGDPKQVIVSIMLDLMPRLHEAALSGGVKVDMVTELVAGFQIIATLSEMLSAAGIVPEQQLPQFTADVAKATVDAHNQRAQQAQPAQPAPMPGGMAGAPA